MDTEAYIRTGSYVVITEKSKCVHLAVG